MDISAITKSALVGAVLLIALSLFNLIPFYTVVLFVVSFGVYLIAGFLAAYWMKPPINASNGAKNGAVAALLAAMLSIAGRVVIFMVTGSSQLTAMLSTLPPEQHASILGAFKNPEEFAGGFGYLGVFGVLLGLFGLWAIIAIIFGAAAGSFWAGGGENPVETTTANTVTS